MKTPTTVAEWDAMSPEEQDALIASGWHPGPGAYSERALQVRYARRDRDYWKERAKSLEEALEGIVQGANEARDHCDDLDDTGAHVGYTRYETARTDGKAWAAFIAQRALDGVSNPANEHDGVDRDGHRFYEPRWNLREIELWLRSLGMDEATIASFPATAPVGVPAPADPDTGVTGAVPCTRCSGTGAEPLLCDHPHCRGHNPDGSLVSSPASEPEAS